MAFKVNYGLQKAERTRAKQAKKESKLREREAQAASGGTTSSPESDPGEAPAAEAVATETAPE